jgi:hypothetical protein
MQHTDEEGIRIIFRSYLCDAQSLIISRCTLAKYLVDAQWLSILLMRRG